jgi:sugar O-acyltransferase (sialic acid O-acetyltransferase NeuD family)
MIMVEKVVLYGAGGHCKVVIDILESLGVPIGCLVDDGFIGDNFMGYEVRKNTGVYGKAVITIGACGTRKLIVDRIVVSKYFTAIHPSAIVSNRAVVKEGTVVMQGAIIQSCAVVGRHNIINTGASIDHDCYVGDYVHVSPHSTLCGNVFVDEGSWIGAGSTIISGIRIGKWSVIGAGSVVTRDIPDNVLAFGNRCEIIKNI